MKTTNRATKSSLHVAAALAAGILAVSGLAMGTAMADSNPLPIAQQSTQSAQGWAAMAHSSDVASAADLVAVTTADPPTPQLSKARQDDGNVTPSQPINRHTSQTPQLGNYGPHGPSFR